MEEMFALQIKSLDFDAPVHATFPLVQEFLYFRYFEQAEDSNPSTFCPCPCCRFYWRLPSKVDPCRDRCQSRGYLDQCATWRFLHRLANLCCCGRGGDENHQLEHQTWREREKEKRGQISRKRKTGEKYKNSCICNQKSAKVRR